MSTALHRADGPVYPVRSPRVLLASVFGPYAQDDQYGSRTLNPMELFHNQVTRVQGPFSFRSFYRSWGLMLIQVNLEAPCTLLDFPSEARFVEELRSQPYDVIGISSIIPNLLKVRRMCRLIRKHQPAATIVVGGHVANVPDLKRWVDADHIVRGDGVRWMRRFLGEDENRPIQHPQVLTNTRPRILGVPLGDHAGLDYATLIPGVGCPLGCNFCSNVRHVRRQGPLHRVLQDRPGAVPDHGRAGVEPGRPRLLRHGRELLAGPPEGAATARSDGEARQVVVPANLQLGQRPAALQHARTGRAGGHLDMARHGGQGLAVRQARRHRHQIADPRAARTRDPRARLQHYRPRRAHAGEH